MSATKSQASWAGVSHGSTAITRVNSVAISKGGKLSTYKGDGDVYPSVVAHFESMPKVTVTTADPAVVMGISEGTDATFSATHKDSKLATGGDILYVVTHCVLENVDTTGNHADFGTATATFLAYAADGVTPPISLSRA